MPHLTTAVDLQFREQAFFPFCDLLNFFFLLDVAKCEPACRNGGVCTEPNKCLCKNGYSGAQCEKSEQGMPNDQEKDGILDHIIDMTSYLLDLTGYIV